MSIIFFITILGISLRFFVLSNLPLSYDEAFDILLSRNPDFSVRSLAIIEGHPPFYFMFSYLWQEISKNLYFVRLSSLIFGGTSILLTALIVKKLFNEKAAYFAALLMAVSPSHVFYSSVARSYSVAITETVLIIYFFIKFINDKKNTFLLTFLLILGIYTHYFFVIMLIVMNLYLIFQKKISRRWILINLAIILICSPLIYLISSTPKFQAPPYPSFLKLPGFYIFSHFPWDLTQHLEIYQNKSIDLLSVLAIITVSISLFFLFAGAFKLINEKTIRPLIFLYISSSLVIMIISYTITSIAALRSFIIFSPFYIFIASTYLSKFSNLPKNLLVVSLTLVSISFWSGYFLMKNTNPNVSTFQNIYRNLEPESTVVYNDISLFLPSKILNPQGKHFLVFQGPFRLATYDALGISLLSMSNIPDSKRIRYVRSFTNWPPFEKDADNLGELFK